MCSCECVSYKLGPGEIRLRTEGGLLSLWDTPASLGAILISSKLKQGVVRNLICGSGHQGWTDPGKMVNKLNLNEINL